MTQESTENKMKDKLPTIGDNRVKIVVAMIGLVVVAMVIEVTTDTSVLALVLAPVFTLMGTLIGGEK